MKLIRLLSKLFLLTAILAIVLVLVAFIPPVQTWVAQTVLESQPDVHGSMGSLWARFGKVDVADLKFEIDGAVFTAPSLEANLPLFTAIGQRKVAIGRLVAKGWVLDLSHISEARSEHAQGEPVSGDAGETNSSPQTAVNPAQKAVRVFQGILNSWKLPCDMSFDGFDLDGDVLVAVAPNEAPIRVHVSVKGGGLAAGHEGAFSFDASNLSVDSANRVVDLSAHGRLVVAMDSPRTLNRVEFKGDGLAKTASLPQGFALSANVAVVRSTGEETYRVELSRSDRLLATVLAHFPYATRRFAGTWKLDLRDPDLAPFTPHRRLPSFAATGEGEIDADAALAQVHALGHLNAVGSHLSVLAPSLNSVGTVTLDTRFDLINRGESIRVDRLSASLGGDRPIAVVQSLQSFDFAKKNGHLTVVDSGNDWIKGSFDGFPLAWLSVATGGFTFAGGDVNGEFVARAANENFVLSAKTPFNATGVIVQRAGRMVVQALDLSFSPLVDYSSKKWQMQSGPVTIDSAGHRLATIEVKASTLEEAGRPVAITGTWNVDLEALASQSAIPDLNGITARSTSGNFSATAGTATTMEGDVVVTGHDASTSITGKVHMDLVGSTVALKAPVKIDMGSSKSEVSVEGRWSTGKADSPINLWLRSKDVTLQHLEQLAGPLAAMKKISLPSGFSVGAGGPQTSSGVRDRIPFWGEYAGKVTVVFDRFRAAGQDLHNVSGTFDANHKSVRLEDGMYTLPGRSLVKVTGEISFDPVADSPYTLKGSVDGAEIDAASLFGTPPHGEDLAVEGHFSVAAAFTGNGINLNEMIDHTRGEFHLKSKTGIVRLLKTRISDTIPNPSTPVSDTLVNVGSAVGSLFGLKKGFGSGQVHLSKNTDAVLNFTYDTAEIAYNEFTVTAIREPDRTIHLTEIAVSTRDERLTGTGKIDYVKDLPLPARPLSVEFQFGARGQAATLLSNTDLLSSRKDNQGYTLFDQPIHFGGTLEHMDKTQWHDVLAKAAVPKADAGKKDGDKASGVSSK